MPPTLVRARTLVVGHPAPGTDVHKRLELDLPAD
jgi:hypothetical protein